MLSHAAYKDYFLRIEKFGAPSRVEEKDFLTTFLKENGFGASEKEIKSIKYFKYTVKKGDVSKWILIDPETKDLYPKVREALLKKEAEEEEKKVKEQEIENQNALEDKKAKAENPPSRKKKAFNPIADVEAAKKKKLTDQKVEEEKKKEAVKKQLTAGEARKKKAETARKAEEARAAKKKKEENRVNSGGKSPKRVKNSQSKKINFEREAPEWTTPINFIPIRLRESASTKWEIQCNIRVNYNDCPFLKKIKKKETPASNRL